MKFANISLKPRSINNIGDQLQLLAIDRIYSTMGLKCDDIVYLDYRQLSNYNGEYVILPITMPMADYSPHGLAGRFSDHIIPVFLGLTMVKQTLSKEEVEYLKKWQPIGCRDEYTLNTVRKYGIIAYLHGCITVTFPRRPSGKHEKVYIVDVDSNLMNTIPAELKEGAEFRTHIRTAGLDDPKAAALKQYNEYIDNAGLVITSLLHCAVPCMAAGIPVVFLKSHFSFRFSWLDKLLPIYTPDNANSIDWNPKDLDIRDHQRRVLELTVDRLEKEYHKYEGILGLSYYYEDRVRHEYINDTCKSIADYINQNWTEREKAYKYSIWCMTERAEWVVDYISDNYPNAILCHVYDSYRKETFRGIMSEHPEEIKNHMDETVFVTANNSSAEAVLELLDRSSFPKSQSSAFHIVY